MVTAATYRADPSHTRNVRLRYSLVVTAELGVGVVAGWGVGRAKDTCEQSCPATGPCPEPPGCGSHPFHWLPAIVIALFVTILLSSVAIAVIRRND